MGIAVSSRVWLAIFALFFAAALAVPGVAFPAAEEPVAEEAPPSLPPLPDESSITSALKEAHAAELKAQEQREQELASPAAVQEREESALAYGDLSPAQAEGLLLSTFGDILEELNQDPARYLSDARLDEVREVDAATVTKAGETQLLEANVPVRAEDEEGELSKVDLSLVPVEGGWEAENPLVEVAIGDSAEEGVELSEAEVGISQADAAASAGRLMGDKNLFFGEVAPDTDLLVSPKSTGVELFDVLRSADSPESIRFDIEMPDGAELRAGPGGSAEVVDEAGEPSVVIPAPWARDAQGTAVPVEMQVEGNSLILNVAHRQEDFAYPILVDPTMYQNWGWWYQGQNLTGLGAFRWQQSAGAWWVNHGTEDTGFPGYEGKGLFIATAPGSLGANQWGQYIYSAPNGGSYLANATINPFWRNNRQCSAPNPYYEPYDYTGMWTEAGGWNRLLWNNANEQGWSNLESWGEALIIGMSTNNGTYIPCWRDLMIGGVGIWLDDYQYPWLSVVSSPSGWLKKDGTNRVVDLKAYDEGLGVQRVRMYAGAKEWNWDQAWCAGTYENRCGTERAGKVNFTTESVGAEGKVNLGVQAIDPTDKRWALERTVMIDGTAPTLTLKGEQQAASYKLDIEAKDGSSTEPRSGVKEVKVYLDGQLKQTKSSSCSTSGCPATVAFTYTQSHSGLSLGQHTLEVVATDQVGYTKSASTTFSVEQPDTIIDSGPNGLTNDSTPSFTYHSTLTGSTFQCSVDGGAYVSCPGTGYTTPPLTDGSHTFSVKATSGAGHVDPTPASRTFTVDATPPNTTIDYGPEGATNDGTPAFGYSSDDPDARFECKLDSAAFAPCGNGAFEAENALSEGAHTFTVRAVDRAGNPDPSPASRSFSVDATPPTVSIQSGPSGATNNPKPIFTFTSSGASSLACAIDAEATEGDEPSYGACTTSTSHTPLLPLSDGPYTFRVRASDEAGNQALDLREFTVDTVAPQTTIDSGPSGTTDEPKPTFTFSSSEGGSSFQCRFDAQAFAPCSGPGAAHTPTTALGDGPHTFEVRAVDPAGNADLTPAARAFTVSTGGPQTTITAGPEGATAQTSVTFKYTADEPATFQCRLDGAAFLPCPSGEITYPALAEGRHVFEVRAVNNAAVVDPTPASRTFVVDTTAPPPPAASGPVREPTVPGLTLHLEAEDGDPSSSATARSGVQSLLIYADGQLVETLEARCKQGLCPAEMVRTAQLPHQNVIGSHNFEVRAQDGVGNLSAPVAWSESTEKAGTLVDREGTATTSAACGSGNLNVVTVHKGATGVRGTNQSDLIISRPGVRTIMGRGGCDTIIGGPSLETIRGGPDADLIRGGRNNDLIRGEQGADNLYGGVGDDQIFGEQENDVLDGSHGADNVRGGPGNDLHRGGQGEDELFGGVGGTDIVSYADAVAPGFIDNGKQREVAEERGKKQNIGNFPDFDESGVYIDLGDQPARAYNGQAGHGGGIDRLVGATKGDFERIVGSPFSDWIEGSAGATQIDPGRGADLVRGVGAIQVTPGPDPQRDSVNDNPSSITPRGDSLEVQIGTQEPATGLLETSVYMVGGTAVDQVRVKATNNAVRFVVKNPAKANVTPLGECHFAKDSSTVTCPVAARLGAVVVYGGKNNDRIDMAAETPQKPGTIILHGAQGADRLMGLGMDELMIDGASGHAGNDVLHGANGDDALFQGVGDDTVVGGAGSDLVVSSHICGGDQLWGDAQNNDDPGADNAQFAPLKESGVFVDLEDEELGKINKGNTNKCGQTLHGFNDAEGSEQRDVLYGTNEANLIIGRGGSDSLFGLGKKDKLNANDDTLDEKIDCGGQKGDKAIADPVDRAKRAVTKKDCPRISKVGKKQGQPSAKGRVSMFALTGSEPPAVGDVGSAPDQPDPMSYYALDESSGTSAENGMEGSNGTYKAVGVGPSVNGPGPTLGVADGLAGEDGFAVKLDGVDDYVDLNGAALPAESEDGTYSVAMLVKFARAPGQVEYLFSGFGSGEGVFLFRDSSGRLVFATGLDQGAPRVRSADPIKDEKWHQVIGTLEGETITINVDGFPYRLGYGSPVHPEKQPTQSLVGAGPGLVQLLAGTVDEVVAFEGVLSDGDAFAQLSESEAEEPALLLAPPPETADNDGDGVTDGADNCPTVSNSDQADVDLDGIGDACNPPDSDGDAVTDAEDNCPFAFNPEQADSNSDGLGDECTEMPPDASTEPATNVKGTTATINALVDPEGSATSYQFEYGTTSAYGTTIPLTAKSAGAGVDPVAVSEALSGLQPGTTYYYRIVAWNMFGDVEGESRTFKTLSPPGAFTQAATNVETTSAVLKGLLLPQGDPTTYQFEYGKTTSYGSKVPLSPKSAGSTTGFVSVSESVVGLEPNTTYHFRVVATNGGGTANGNDLTFKTKGLPITGPQLGAMPVTHPFNGSSSSLADFASKWSALGWAVGPPPKGEDSLSGWRPVEAFPSPAGAYYNPSLTDTGEGVAAVATLSGAPTIAERYFSLWLDMNAPTAATRDGYELRFTEVSSNSYTVTLSKWVKGVQTVLASKSAYGLPVGSSVAIVDQGSTVSAWTDTGSGFGQVLTATDSAYAGGNAGVEGAGNILRLSNFRAGVPVPAVANMSAALSALKLNDSFATNQTPLTGGGNWAALQWASSAYGYPTGWVSGGWGPYDAFSTINGAFWQPNSFTDTGSGTAVAATLTSNATIAERYFSLWLDMPTPASTRSGYELRFTETASNIYSVTLSRWQSGTKTLLASKTGYSMPVKSQFALVDKGGTVSAWVKNGGEFLQVLTAADTTFASGYTGIEASGNIIRLTDFRSGPLPPF